MFVFLCILYIHVYIKTKLYIYSLYYIYIQICIYSSPFYLATAQSLWLYGVNREGWCFSTLCHSCRFDYQWSMLKMFLGPAYYPFENGVVWLWHFMVNLYIYINKLNILNITVYIYRRNTILPNMPWTFRRNLTFLWIELKKMFWVKQTQSKRNKIIS